jgi:hypothetical protein
MVFQRKRSQGALPLLCSREESRDGVVVIHISAPPSQTPNKSMFGYEKN